MSNKIIINADDFGLTHSVNKAIVDVYKIGNLTSTTLMVNMPGTEDAVALSHENPGLAIGLHLCLTEGQPLTQCRSLLDTNNNFIPRKELIQKAIKKQLKITEIQNEFKAQYDKIKDFGIEITHVDSHQHILQIPFIFSALNPLLEKLELKVRRVNPSKIPWSLNPSLWPRLIKNIVNARTSSKMRTNSKCAMNDVLVSVHDKFADTGFSKETYLDLISDCNQNDSIEIMVHPYILNEDVIEMYKEEIDFKMPFLQKCAKEYELLSQHSLFDNYQKISFKDLPFNGN